MANEGFGSGLALSYKIPRDQFAMAERAMKQRNDFDKAKAATKKQDDAAVQSWMKSVNINPSKVDRWDWDEANKNGAEAAAIIERRRNSGDPDWQNGLYADLQPIIQRQGELIKRTEDFKLLDANIDKDAIDKNSYPEQRELMRLRREGTQDDARKFKDPYGNIGISTDSRGRVIVGMGRMQREDIDVEVKKEMNTDYNRSFLGRVMEAQIDPAVKQYLVQNGLPKNKKDAQDIANSIGWKGQLPTTLEDIVKNKQSNLGSRRGYIRQMGDVLEKDYPEFFDDKTTQDRKEEILTEAGLKRYANLSGIKSIEKSVRREKPRVETQSEKDKEWKTDGTSYFNGKNKVTVSNLSETDIPQIVNMPSIANNPNAKVFTYSHKDVSENKPLLFYDNHGKPVEGTFKGVIADVTDFKKTGQIIVVVKSKTTDEDGRVQDKLDFQAIPYNKANVDIISNEYEVSPEKVLEGLNGGTGAYSDGGQVKSIRSSVGGTPSTTQSPTNGFQDFTVNGTKYRIPQGKVDEFKKEMGISDGKKKNEVGQQKIANTPTVENTPTVTESPTTKAAAAPTVAPPVPQPEAKDTLTKAKEIISDEMEEGWMTKYSKNKKLYDAILADDAASAALMEDRWHKVDKSKINKDFKQDIDEAKAEVYLNTNPMSEDWNGNFGKNWAPRIRMWEKVDFSNAPKKGWDESWTKKILAHERKVGAPSGQPFTDGRYDDDKWTGKNADKFNEYIEKVSKELKKGGVDFDSLPPEVKVRLVDYKFNTGRSVKELITYAMNRTTEE